MKLVLLNSPSSSAPWINELESEYQKKIQPFFPFQIIKLSSKKKSERADFQAKRKDEAALILRELNDRDFVILWDERGKSYSSLLFAKQLERALGTGKQRICFIIGGAYGVDPSVQERADLTVSMSAFVLNHLIAKAVALEQLYRALTIIKNIPYHNE